MKCVNLWLIYNACCSNTRFIPCYARTEHVYISEPFVTGYTYYEQNTAALQLKLHGIFYSAPIRPYHLSINI